MTKRMEWQQGWPTVLAAFMGVAASSMPSFTLGVIMEPMQTAYGWSRAEITSMITIITVCILVLSPIVGGLVDRFGARRIALSGVCFYCLAFASLSLTGSSTTLWHIASGLVGIGMALTGSTVWISAVARQFDRSRALAISIALSGLGLSVAITPALTIWALSAVGIDQVYFVLAAAAFILAFPVAFVFFHDREPAFSGVGQPEPGAQPAPEGLTFGEAVRSTRFWRLVISMLIVASCASTLLIHYVPIMTAKGVSPTQAAFYMSLIGPASITGRLVCGALMDRIFAPVVAAVSFSLAAAGFLLLLNYDGSAAMSLLIPFLVGFASGAEVDVAAYLTVRYFGLRSFGAIYGLVQGCVAMFYGSTPIIAAVLFDRTGSYGGLIGSLLGALAVSIALVATLGRYPRLAHPLTMPTK